MELLRNIYQLAIITHIIVCRQHTNDIWQDHEGTNNVGKQFDDKNNIYQFAIPSRQRFLPLLNTRHINSTHIDTHAPCTHIMLYIRGLQWILACNISYYPGFMVFVQYIRYKSIVYGIWQGTRFLKYVTVWAFDFFN